MTLARNGPEVTAVGVFLSRNIPRGWPLPARVAPRHGNRPLGRSHPILRLDNELRRGLLPERPRVPSGRRAARGRGRREAGGSARRAARGDPLRRSRADSILPGRVAGPRNGPAKKPEFSRSVSGSAMQGAKWALPAIGAIAILAGTGFVAQGGWRFGGPPEQPIAFPHDVHAGTLQIPCMYCHYTADRSPDAGIPSVQTCAGCHLAGGQPIVRADRPGVQQLAEYWQRGVPIP